MPHVSNDRDNGAGSSGGGGDDLCSSDEIKVFKEEDGEDEKRSTCDRVNEDKCDLIDLSESDIKSENAQSYSNSKHNSRNDLSPVYGKAEHPAHASFNMGYLVSPYPCSNGPPPALPISMASKMGLGAPPHPGAGLPFFCHNGEHLTQPPPAHMGIPPYQLDPKGTGLPRPPMYPFAGGQYPYPMLSPEMTQVAATWHSPYPISTSGSPAGFRGPYPSIPITSSALPSDFYRFSPTGILPGHHGSLGTHPHPALVTPGPKQELLHHSDINHRSHSLDHKNSTNDAKDSCNSSSNNQDKKKPHIKKPLNAFMLYMKEMRAKVVAECTLKESAAINQILGRRWHSLSRDEQAKYYEKARQERQLHMELYPGWSARDNYGYGAKKKKRKKERITLADSVGGIVATTLSGGAGGILANSTSAGGGGGGGNSMKKCRARYGLDQQSQWCKPCRRKKRCIRYVENGGDSGNQSDGSGDSTMGDTKSAEDEDGESSSFQHSLSSPGALSGLSSLTSPSMILPSPSASLASPSVSLASPCMSMQSPLTPHGIDYDCPSTNKSSSSVIPNGPASSSSSSAATIAASLSCLPLLMHPLGGPIQPSKNPVGTNPHDINNPLSVNQLTGKCVKNSSASSSSSSSISSSSDSANNSSRNNNNNNTNKDSRYVIRVT